MAEFDTSKIEYNLTIEDKYLNSFCIDGFKLMMKSGDRAPLIVGKRVENEGKR